MGLLKRLFGGKPDKDTARTAMLDAGQDAGRTIRYDPGLVDGLKDDHQELVAMYTALGERVAAGDFHGVDAALQEFKIRLEAHLLTENVRFYVYVEQSMAEDEVNYELIRGFRKEMNSIARAVVEFVRRYRQQPVGPATQAQFIREHGEVGRLLAQRIAREESELYVLYQP